MTTLMNAPRRSFIKSAALASAVLAATGDASVQGAGKRKFRRRSPSSAELLEIGVLTVTGGHADPIWGHLINPVGGKTRLTGMVMTQAWDIDTGALDGFSKKFDLKKAASYDAMAGKVDGVILTDYASLFWNPELARPYLDAGTPIYINRPFAASVVAMKDMIERAKKNGTPLMTSSSLEYVQAVDSIRQMLPELGEITGYVADNAQSDYITHGTHGIWFVHKCVGGGVKSVSYQTEDWTRPNGAMIFEHFGRNDGKNFYGLLMQAYRSGSAWIRVSGKGTTNRADGYANDVHIERQMDWPREGRGNVVDSAIWLPLLHTVQRFFETGVMPESFESIEEKTRMFIGGLYSHLEKKGAPVLLSEIPPDWECPRDRPPMNAARYPKGFFK